MELFVISTKNGIDPKCGIDGDNRQGWIDHSTYTFDRTHP